MGKFFNDTVMGMKKIPPMKLEKLREEWNAKHLRSETEAEEGILPAINGNGGKPEPDVSIIKKKRQKRIRQSRKGHPRQTGNN